MFRQVREDLKRVRELSPGFFRFSVLVIVLYALQLVLKIEITPLGYFSLYSDRMSEQKEYNQILPTKADGSPLNIYDSRGDQFLIMEILPTRYQILANSDHCNQMNFKLEKLGMKDMNCCDCDRLRVFNAWFKTYSARVGFDTTGLNLHEYGFRQGKILSRNELKDSAIY